MTTTTPFPRDTLPVFNQIDPPAVAPFFRELLEKNRKKIADLLAQPGPFTWDNLMQPLEEINDELSKKWSPISHMHAVVESEGLRKAYHETLPLITQYHTELSQNEALFNAISSIKNSKEFANLSRAQRKIIENDVRDFKLSGIHLPPDKKKEIANYQQQLTKTMTAFSENVLDATHAFIYHTEDKSLLDGLPNTALQLAIDNAKQRNLSGYVLTLDYPSYSTAIKFLKNRELRKMMYEAYVTRASDCGPYAGRWDNLPIMEKILENRHALANVVGFPQYASYSLATKMAKTPDEVLHFLQDLLARTKPIAEKEYHEVAELAKAEGLSDIKPWDFSYYSEKLREAKFQFSQEDLRVYFPIDRVMHGMFTLVNKLYGITIKPESGVSTWHPQAQFFSVYDAEQKLRGGFYVDLYARPHKRDGAWMDECLCRFQKRSSFQYPVAYLTCNFMPPVNGKSALLSHEEVLTLFHEFGHCLHHLLTKVDYPSIGGINGVPWDAVEFPSQFLENFCWEKPLLAFITSHHITHQELPDDLYQKMLNAKNFQSGLQMMRQLEFALFDFRLHLEFNPRVPHFIQTVLDDVRKQTSILPVAEFNRFQNSFSHIFAGSYAAGYYSYKWAEVLSADAYAQFEKHGIFDRNTGLAFLENILEVGGVPDPMTAFINFKGSPPTIDALLEQSGIVAK